VTEQRAVPRAKFPVVDIHGHAAQQLQSPQGLTSLVKDLDSLNVGLFVGADNLSGASLQRAVAAIRSSNHADRFRVLAGVNFSNVGPGWAAKAVAQLEADIAAGAVGVGEIGKSLGLTTTKADGTRLRVDDPALDPIWEACARLNVPVFIHTGEPRAFFQPLDMRNERWLELALFCSRTAGTTSQVR
jgi:hypothetical protein